MSRRDSRNTLNPGRSLPDYIQREFEEFLACGRLEHGFLRVYITARNASTNACWPLAVNQFSLLRLRSIISTQLCLLLSLCLRYYRDA